MTPELFRTPVQTKSQTLVSPDKSMVSLGSCFADIIGNKLRTSGFKISVNPFGTLFHPYSIFAMLDPDAKLDPDLFLTSAGMVHHFHLPKTFFAKDEESLEREWQARHQGLQRTLKDKAILLLTLGTSYVYQREGRWVTNCQQRPGHEFQKALTHLEDMRDSWKALFPKLPKDLQIVLSLSPVRHAKDGLVENNLSKSLLRVLIQDLVHSDPSRIHYFPAYEILLDELRDYRFYASDMLHPSEVASDYIWRNFQEAYLDAAARERIKTWEKLEARQKHRPLHPESAEYKRFQEELAKDLKAFEES